MTLTRQNVLASIPRGLRQLRSQLEASADQLGLYVLDN